ncbi:MAG: hypothetical protein ACJ76N_23915 [Thermoanaerobaculia bacterium]
MLASLAPVALFFNLSAPEPGPSARTAHNLLYLLHTALVGGCGLGGTVALWKAMRRLDALLKTLRAVYAVWVAAFALVLLALLPINWLFSSSSRHLGSATLLQLFLWLIALSLAWRFLGQGLRATGARGGMVLWLFLFCVVSLQAATVLRPVLSRKPGGAVFVSGKKSFLEQIGDVFDEDDERTRAAKPAAAPKPEAKPPAGAAKR